jgi:hypothetical protein
MDIILIILCGILLFVLLGIAGWGLKVLGWIIEFLEKGFSTSFGCLLWIFAILAVIIALSSG